MATHQREGDPQTILKENLTRTDCFSGSIFHTCTRLAVPRVARITRAGKTAVRVGTVCFAMAVIVAGNTLVDI